MLFRKKKPLPSLEGKLSHIAFIMDGNGRWAKKRALPRESGHVVGAKTFKTLVEHCSTRGLKTITFYAFSTENWKRPEKEVQAILRLLDTYLDQAIGELADHAVRVRFLGDIEPLPQPIREKIRNLEERSIKNPLLLQIAFNYGGRAEIVHAVNQAFLKKGAPLSEADIEENLYSDETYPPDLIIRTAGEKRLSNFLMWQSAYAEFYFTDCLWPDFGPAQLEEAISDYFKRTRRFGGL